MLRVGGLLELLEYTLPGKLQPAPALLAGDLLWSKLLAGLRRGRLCFFLLLFDGLTFPATGHKKIVSIS